MLKKYSLIIVLLLILVVDMYSQDVTYTVYPINGSSGSIDLHMNAGTPPFDFNWEGPQGTSYNSEDISGLTIPGSYCVTITDANCCQGDGCINIVDCNGPAFPFTITETHSNTALGSDDGKIDITVSGISSGNYDYYWTKPPSNNVISTNEDISGLLAGTYCVRVIDACGAPAQLCVEITTCQIEYKGSDGITRPCLGLSNGAINLKTSGVQSFLWSTGATTEDISGISAGTYTVTMTDAAGCSVVHSEIVVNSPPDFTVQSVIEAACPEGGGGSIDLTIVGGTGPFTYAWNNGASTPDISGLSFGIYRVTITDGNGCKAIKLFSVGDRKLTFEANLTHPCTANEPTGAINLLIQNNGYGPYTFAWSTGATTQNLSGLGPGNYCVTITDADGCKNVSCHNLILSSPNVLQLTAQHVTVRCSSGSNGSIKLGSLPFGSNVVATWTTLSGTFVGTGNTISNLAPGDYCVSIVPTGGGCELAEGCFTVGTTLLSIGISSVINASYCDDNQGNPDCNGSIDLSIMPAGSNVTISWVGPNGFTSTSEDIKNLCTGGYAVTVTDNSSGCVFTEYASICCCYWQQGDASWQHCFPQSGPPPLPQIYLDEILQVDDNSPFGAISITVIPSDGIYNYNYYSWSGPNGFQSAAPDISGLSVGNYCVTVTNGCQTISDCFEIVDCSDIVWNVNANLTPSCPGANAGIINITNVTGGEPPFRFKLGSQTNLSGTFNQLATGNHTVTIVDANGCQESVSFTIVNAPPVINVAPTVGHTCPGYEYGSILQEVSGNAYPNFTYSWSQGGNGQSAYNLDVGNYQVTINDGRGCTVVRSYSINDSNELEPEEEVNDCTHYFYCNEQEVFDLTIYDFDVSGYDPDDCRYYDYLCQDIEFNTYTYYPDGNTTGYEFNDYTIVWDFVNCEGRKECVNGDLFEPATPGTTIIKKHSGGDGSNNCFHCFTAEYCSITIDGITKEELLGDGNIIDFLFPSVLNNTDCPDMGSESCLINLQCNVPGFPDQDLATEFCDPTCLLSTGDTPSYICDDLEDVLDLFTGFPDSRNTKTTESTYSDFEVRINPNPFTSYLNVAIKSDVSNELIFNIFNVTGALVKTIKFSINEGISNIRIDDLLNYPAGIYYLRVSNEYHNNIKSFPIVKQ